MEAQHFVSKFHRREKTVCPNRARASQGKITPLDNIMISNTFLSYVFVTLPPDNPGYTAGLAAPADF
jgi:hypothetical protein